MGVGTDVARALWARSGTWKMGTLIWCVCLECRLHVVTGERRTESQSCAVFVDFATPRERGI